MRRSHENRRLSVGFARAWILILLGVAAAGGEPAAEPEFSFAATPGQLPKDVVPGHYAIALQPDVDKLSFSGSETIDLDVREATDRIVLNAQDLSLANARIEDLNLAADVALDAERQTAILRFPRPLDKGPHRLRLDFKGTINAAAEGLFYTRYRSESGQQKILLCTEMEPTAARRVFPLWDEPVFRSSFALTVQVPESYTAISNMPAAGEQLLGNGLRQVEFARTPAMASYLLVFCAGEFEALADQADGLPVRILTTGGKKENGRYALETLKQLLPYYADYFGSKYPLPKLDLIALPGGLGGAMENWGGITFNEALLLFDPNRSPQQTKENIFSIIAHEVAHQWFGNLVTMAWWDQLWLNEGFASWMQIKATDHFNPAWRVWLSADLEKLEVMDIDARSTSHPIEQAVHDPAEAVSAFDAITYTKAAEIIRMFEGYLGENIFRAGIRSYMAEHQYSNTTSADLWESLERASGQAVRSIASSWTEQPGFPLIRVQSECIHGQRGLRFAQERFTINVAQAEPLQWQVPLEFAYGDGKAAAQNFLLYGPAAWLTDGDCAGYAKLNDGNTGYYRVQYAAADRQILLDRFARLSSQDRLNLLGDAWALMLGDRAGSADYLDLVERLQGERELAVWRQVIHNFDEIDRLQRGEPGRAAFQAYVREVLRPLYQQLGWEAKPGESELDVLLRTAVIAALGRYGDAAVIAEARQRFEAFTKAETSLPPNLRAAVFGIVGRHADQRTYDWLHDWGRNSTSTEQKEIAYAAMAAAADPQLAERSLGLALGDELDPHLAASLVIRVAHDGEHPELAWAFLQAHRQALLAKLAFFGRYRFVAEIAEGFADSAHARELLSFAAANLPADALPEMKKAAERIEFKEILARRERPKIDAWVCRRLQGGGC